MTIRLGAVVLMWAALPTALWRLPHPAQGLALAAALTLGALVVLAWERRHSLPHPATLALDLPLGTAALLAGLQAAPGGFLGWSFFAYPYTVLLSFTFGLSCRSLAGAWACGAVWGSTYATAMVLMRDEPVLPALVVVGGYLINPTIGRLCAVRFTRDGAELSAARTEAITQATRLAVERERERQARSLHDHVLQTLDTLLRIDAIADPELRERTMEGATWLRALARPGHGDAGGRLRRALAETVVAGRARGLTITVRDAALDRPGAAARVSASAMRDLLLLLGTVLKAPTSPARGVSVRVEAEQDHVRFVVVPDSTPTPLPQAALDAVSAQAAAWGCGFAASPDGIIEMWTG
ncbi:hypothetical protein AB0K12_17805 [Nonomuraea sp. NPDC049419]|uniref:hypothetical protein n=1 Tax=unclassified Nonomuraea TaxID=2593643 RepID=UPI0034211D70